MHQITKAVEIEAQPRSADQIPEEDETQRDDLPDGVEVFRLTGPLFFGVAGNLIDTLNNIGQMPKVLILRMRRVPYLDATGAAAIDSLIALCRTKGAKIILAAVQPQPMKILSNAGVRGGKDGVLMAPSYSDAVKEARQIIDH
jgi:SulP family sulfate permease